MLRDTSRLVDSRPARALSLESGLRVYPHAGYDGLMQEERKGYVRPVTAETAVHQFGPLRQAACLDHPLARLPRVDRHASGTNRSDLS